MAKKNESSETLRDRILGAMLKEIGISEKMAQPLVEVVMHCLAGERPYFPAISRVYPIDAIRHALETGESADRVAKKFGISRSQLHRLFPGGLPRGPSV
ncbi:hypothetical protein C9397_14535 [Xanthomonas vasicola pv. vasculorum]|nr:hypothetical protein CXP37_20715 [Xanthomonas vasicola pv. vasculorum]KGR38539.1 hypothetical protein NX04_19960 [Xanthomonas vasicola]KGR39043.1 hypothetical protein NX05_19215 [Xanthomonas vasicola]KGR59333.1 hypothetical protein NX79_15205 [Xanthomonas vasicola]OWF61126.1 hypothetical protein B1H32_09375 [Xanthomonas vasicola pv. vasculorum]